MRARRRWRDETTLSSTPRRLSSGSATRRARFPVRWRPSGQIEVEPGGANVVPGRARISIDARAPDSASLDELIAAIGFEPKTRTEPVALGAGAQAALKAEIEERGLPVVELPSGAGHDAGILAAAGVDAGMLFVRSLNGGVSHSPDELSSPDDIALAIEVLTGALERLS